jgi:hypothetical protein
VLAGHKSPLPVPGVAVAVVRRLPLVLIVKLTGECGRRIVDVISNAEGMAGRSLHR